MPILPDAPIRILSKPFVAMIQSFASTVPIKLLFAVVPINEVLAVVLLLPVSNHELFATFDHPNVAVVPEMPEIRCRPVMPIAVGSVNAYEVAVTPDCNETVFC